MRVAGPASELPTGTVTFVFTDIEDSTGLVLELGEDYGPVILQHRWLVRDAGVCRVPRKP